MCRKGKWSTNSSTLATIEIMPKTIQINIHNNEVVSQGDHERKSVVSKGFKDKIEKLASQFEESLRSKRNTHCSDSTTKTRSYNTPLQEVGI
jgi:hypothetical protein